MQEDIFEDPWTKGGIASGCVEFCEYIWVRTKDNELEPDPKRTKWTPWTDDSADKAWKKNTIVSERMTTIINGNSFTRGSYDAAKVLPGFSTEPEEYYKLARELGDWEVSAYKQIEKELAHSRSKLTDEQKQRFRNWNMESPRAAKLVVTLREAEINRVTLLELAKDSYFGRPVVLKKNTAYSEFDIIRTFEIPDREATIAKYASEMGGETAVANLFLFFPWTFPPSSSLLPQSRISSNGAMPFPGRNLGIPTEITLLIASYLPPADQLSLLHAIPNIADLFNFRQLTSTDENGDTFLHLLARVGSSSEIAPFLPLLVNSSNGPILHQRNHVGATPLMYSTELDNVHFMQLLLKRDPHSVNMVDDEGATALWYAVRSEKIDAIALLLEQPSINYDVISLLITHPDTDLTFPDDTGSPPIHLAICAERTDIVQDMLERAAVEIIELLVAQEGIDVDHPTHSGQTPLITAHYHGSIEALLAHPDVQVDPVDNDGRSALSHTAERGDLHGARPDLKDSEGHTPIGRADMAGHKDMVMLLQAAIGQEYVQTCYRGSGDFSFSYSTN
ncbi:ankyrin repeat-containing domain protein [Aspergillus insuetus]